MTTKEIILKELKENYGIAVSGERLAAICDVSRAAVWKAITSLRNEGCNITGTTNGGYLLQTEDFFSEELFTQYISENFPEIKNCHIEAFKEIDSTNTYAKKILSQCGNLRTETQELTEAGKKYHKSIIVAESQTAGRGRYGRTFVSPSKSGIYISFIYAPEGGIKQASRITAFSAVAVSRAIKALYDKSTSIKWINDIFLDGKKISGILTEGTANFETGLIESAIIGIGINISDNPEYFNNELSKVAGFITSSQEKNKVTRIQLAAQVAKEVFQVLEENPNLVMKEYKEKSFIIGKTVTVHSLIDNSKGDYTAKVIDIDDEASLVVETEDGRKKTLISGEVSLNSAMFTN